MSLLGKEWYGEFIAHKDGFKEGVEEGFKVGYETAKKEFAERKTGKWIEKDAAYICTACEQRLSKLVAYDVGGIYNYCPFCGAKMEVDE